MSYLTPARACGERYDEANQPLTEEQIFEDVMQVNAVVSGSPLPCSLACVTDFCHRPEASAVKRFIFLSLSLCCTNRLETETRW